MAKISAVVGNLIRDIREGRTDPVYLLYGEEEYLINTTLDRMVELLSPGDKTFDFDLFSGEAASLREILVSFDTYPMINPFRLVVVKNHPAFSSSKRDSRGEKTAEERAILSERVSAKIPPSTRVIFTYLENDSGSVNTGSELFRALEQKGRVLHFPILKQGRTLGNDESFQIVTNRLRRHKKTITPEAFIELRELTGGNIGAVVDELDKVLLLVGEREEIERGDVEEMVSRRNHEDLFGFTDSLLDRALPEALGKLAGLLVNQVPLRILYFIIRTYRFLMEAQLTSDSGVASKDVGVLGYNRFRDGFSQMAAGMEDRLPPEREHNLLKQHPYVAYKTMAALKNYSEDEIRESLPKILQADLRLKTTGQDPKLVLETLVVELCMTKN